MKLYISDGRHVFTNVEERIEEHDTALDAPEMLFRESRPDDHEWREKTRNWLAAPLLLTGVTVYLLFLAVASTVLSSDDEVSDHIVDTYEVDTRPVDKPVHEILSDQRRAWGLANWSLIAVPALFVIVNPTTAMLGVAGVLLTFGTLSVMMAFLAAVHAERNVHMMDRIADTARAESLDEACLITGGKHYDDLCELARRYEGIELVEDVDSRIETQSGGRPQKSTPTP